MKFVFQNFFFFYAGQLFNVQVFYAGQIHYAGQILYAGQIFWDDQMLDVNEIWVMLSILFGFITDFLKADVENLVFKRRIS